MSPYALPLFTHLLFPNSQGPSLAATLVLLDGHCSWAYVFSRWFRRQQQMTCFPLKKKMGIPGFQTDPATILPKILADFPVFSIKTRFSW